ncbi:hypothetical protein NDN08_008245 [Rhodosorus marinus]|uniref:BCNT-C domain-containing protein n=1 Tax=Rhodosorus marinus TaxID=101924 RepID=A0AAV8V013_9RHOD|nr:hypothetical protein NDN08_008245 [Rhodosorus marinus]
MSHSFRHLFRTYGGNSGRFTLSGGGKDETEKAHDEDHERADRPKVPAAIEELKPREEKSSKRKRRRSSDDGEDAGQDGAVVDERVVSSTTPVFKTKSSRKSIVEKVDRRIEPDPDYKALSRKFIRGKSLEEVEEQWQAEKKEIWLNFKSRRRDFLRGRKHGSTRVSTK